MTLRFDELRVLQAAEGLADEIWQHVIGWDAFAKDVVGAQLARAADSIGANIAEAFGRFHYGEKLQFLYYARGSLFETKYWINRSTRRRLISEGESKRISSELDDLARQLNGFAQTIRNQRNTRTTQAVAEPGEPYTIDQPSPKHEDLFSAADLHALGSDQLSSPNHQSQSPNP